MQRFSPMRIAAVRAVVVATFLGALVPSARAQQPQPTDEQNRSLPAAPQPSPTIPIQDSAKPGTTIQPVSPRVANAHRFWDRENDLLFAAVGAGRAFDYASTMNIRRRGIDEVFLTNAIVDNHPLFAGIEAAATGASIGVSYIFHRTGHHSLERWTSIVHIGIATGGAIRNYALPTPH